MIDLAEVIEVFDNQEKYRDALTLIMRELDSYAYAPTAIMRIREIAKESLK